MGRKNRRRWAIRMGTLNERILGLNVLWGGWSKAVKDLKGLHWECAGTDFKQMCRKILQWPVRLLNVPECISNFLTVTSRKGATYTEINPTMIPTQEVKADQVALPKEPPVIIPILSILPEKWRSKYELEGNIINNDVDAWVAMKDCKPRLGMAKREYVKIIKLLRQLGMIKFLTVDEVKVVNGMHCVSKENGKQRLIFDGRPVNHILISPEKVSLPDFSLLEDWEVQENEIIRFGKLDLDNFYHRLGVPMWLVPYLALPAIGAKEIGMGKGQIFPACCTLPMGLSHSVLLAQIAHLQVLQEVSIAPSINLKVTKEAEKWAILYIDDVIIAAKAECHKVAEEKVNKIIEECLAAYASTELVVNQKKLVWATVEVTGLGCVFSGRENCITPKEEKIKQIISATRYVLSLSHIAPKNIEILLGHWIWFILLFRPLYSNFYHVYKWLQLGDEYGIRVLWQSVKREFIIIILFADVCRLTWTRKISPELLATDASLWGAGACEIWCEEKERKKNTLPLKQLGNWQQMLNLQWQRLEHINVLEMRALIMSVSMRVSSMKFQGKRWRVLSDSAVVVGAENGLTENTTRRLTIGLASSTVKAYVAAIARFKQEVGIVRFNKLDEQLLDYVQSFPLLSQRSAGEKIASAYRHFFPEITGTLPRLNRFLHQLRRQYKGISKPPMIWDVVILVVFQLVSMGFPVTALGVLLQFDCFLRPNELAQIQVKHIAFPGGKLLGSQAQRVLLLLPKAKTGPLQSVRIQSKLVIKLLSKAAKKNAMDTELFPSTFVYRQRLNKALFNLGLTHIGYTPHSLSGMVRGHTMALINEGEQALPAIMFRGRWESSAGRRAYLQMGAAALLYAEIPEALITQAEEKMEGLPKIFKHLDWVPKL